MDLKKNLDKNDIDQKEIDRMAVVIKDLQKERRKIVNRVNWRKYRISQAKK